MRKRFVIVAGLVFGLMLAASFYRAHRKGGAAEHAVSSLPKAVTAPPPPARVQAIQARSTPAPRGASGIVWQRGGRDQVLGALLDVLEHETTTESLRKLDQVGEYFTPGADSFRTHRTSGSVGAMRSQAEHFLVDLILSNRRFLKVYDEVSKMPKDEAGRLVAAEIEATLSEYKREEDARIARCQAQLTRGEPSGFGAQVGNSPDGSPTFEAERLKLLALALAAGSLKLSEAGNAVLDLTHVALEQRGKFEDPNFLNMYTGSFITYDTVYCTRVLSTALIGTSPEGSDPAGDAAAPARVPPWEEIPLTTYNAKWTAYDSLHGTRPEIAIDYSLGRQTISIHRSVTDKNFDNLILNLK